MTQRIESEWVFDPEFINSNWFGSILLQLGEWLGEGVQMRLANGLHMPTATKVVAKATQELRPASFIYLDAWSLILETTTDDGQMRWSTLKLHRLMKWGKKLTKMKESCSSDRRAVEPLGFPELVHDNIVRIWYRSGDRRSCEDFDLDDWITEQDGRLDWKTRSPSISSQTSSSDEVEAENSSDSASRADEDSDEEAREVT